MGLVMVFFHAGVPLAVASLSIPPRTQRPPRFAPAPAGHYSLIPREVLSEHQIHLGVLPSSVSLTLVTFNIYVYRSNSMHANYFGGFRF